MSQRVKMYEEEMKITQIPILPTNGCMTLVYCTKTGILVYENGMETDDSTAKQIHIEGTSKTRVRAPTHSQWHTDTRHICPEIIIHHKLGFILSCEWPAL